MFGRPDQMLGVGLGPNYGIVRRPTRVPFPIKYLGLPLTLGRLKLVHVQHILDNNKGEASRMVRSTSECSWTARTGTFGAYISAIPVYLLSALKVPKQLNEDIDKARRRFLWAGDGEISGGKCKVAWPLVAKPIEFEGLGILDFERFSRALRLRWLWFSWTDPKGVVWDATTN